MAHTIKCGCGACGCMIANEPGAPAYCNDHCATACSADAAGRCTCGHVDYGKLREVGSGPNPS